MTQIGLVTKTQEALNGYGDRLMPAGINGHGSNISNQRRDDLDLMALLHAQDLVSIPEPGAPIVYDIGCGQGAMSMEFCQIGCAVFACDIEPMPNLENFMQKKSSYRMKLVQKDARLVDWEAYPRPDILYSQRFLHYLPYDEARKLIGVLTGRGRYILVCVSMSGLHSELGQGYLGSEQSLQGRFAHLTPSMAKKHGIEQQVCLYSKEDAEQLAAECDLTIRKLWLSDFGNVKLVAESAVF